MRRDVDSYIPVSLRYCIYILKGSTSRMDKTEAVLQKIAKGEGLEPIFDPTNEEETKTNRTSDCTGTRFEFFVEKKREKEKDGEK